MDYRYFKAKYHGEQKKAKEKAETVHKVKIVGEHEWKASRSEAYGSMDYFGNEDGPDNPEDDGEDGSYNL